MECLRLHANVNVKLMSRCLMSHMSSENPGFSLIRNCAYFGSVRDLAAFDSFGVISDLLYRGCRLQILYHCDFLFAYQLVTLSLYLTTFPQKLH